MVMDARLKKLAKGLDSRAAVDAFLSQRTDPASLSNEQRALAHEFEATIEAMFLMAAVDGEISKQEMGQLAGSVQAIVDISRTPGRKPVNLEATLVELNKKLEKEGWKARLDEVARRLQSNEARSFAFRLAAGVAFIDDHVAHAEAAAIDALAAALQLSSDESQEILHDVQETLFVD
jgi:tellurite resistance protein